MNAANVDRNAPDYCVSVPRMLLTPSRQLVLGFEFEMSNRVIRRFMEEEDFSAEAFLRVQIADEKVGISSNGISPEKWNQHSRKQCLMVLMSTAVNTSSLRTRQIS